MNRLECLQIYPMQCRKIFYLGAPAIFIFFTLTILVSYFELPFKEIQDYWYVPALLGGAFTWYVSRNVIFIDEPENAVQINKDIEANPSFLRAELEKANRSIKHIVKGLVGVFAVTIFLRPPFFREIGQIVDLGAMCCFFAAGAYFRETLHIYSRTPEVSKEEVAKRYTQRAFFQVLGWGALAFFFQKTLGLKVKMGNFWSELSNFQLPDFLLVIALVVYLIGILGISFQIFRQRSEGTLNSIFDACIAFGSTFPIVWIYPYIHPFLFIDMPVWLIQLPGLMLVFVNSIGIYLSFQSKLQEKILGNSCLTFVRHGEQVLIFIFLWAIAVIYAGMTPVIAVIFYGCLFAFGTWVVKRLRSNVLGIIVAVIALSPFLFKMYNGELTEKIASQKARIEKIHQKTS